MNYILLGLIVLIVLFALYFNKSTFINQIINKNYNSSGCTRENRSFPSGNIPGSYLGLTIAERENLLKLFIENNPNST